MALPTPSDFARLGYTWFGLPFVTGPTLSMSDLGVTMFGLPFVTNEAAAGDPATLWGSPTYQAATSGESALSARAFGTGALVISAFGHLGSSGGLWSGSEAALASAGYLPVTEGVGGVELWATVEATLASEGYLPVTSASDSAATTSIMGEGWLGQVLPVAGSLVGSSLSTGVVSASAALASGASVALPVTPAGAMSAAQVLAGSTAAATRASGDSRSLLWAAAAARLRTAGRGLLTSQNFLWGAARFGVHALGQLRVIYPFLDGRVVVLGSPYGTTQLETTWSRVTVEPVFMGAVVRQ